MPTLQALGRAAGIELLYATDDSGGAASATVYSCKEEAADCVVLSPSMVGDLIESQRGHHTWQSRQIFYVDPVNGTTITLTTPGTSTPCHSETVPNKTLVVSRANWRTKSATTSPRF